MNIIHLVLTLISVTAACFSCYYAYNAKRMQENLVSNKNDIDRLFQVIEKLKMNRALQQNSSYFSDADFIAGCDLSHIKGQIVILKQNKRLNELLTDIDWEAGAPNIDKKIETLELCKKLLF